MATSKKAAAKAASQKTASPTDDIAQMPPPGQENTPPEQLAEQNKSDREKDLDAAANARIASGGQSGVGSAVPAAQGVGDVQGKTVTSDELKKSKQPLAPENPLAVPDAEEKK